MIARNENCGPMDTQSARVDSGSRSLYNYQTAKAGVSIRQLLKEYLSDSGCRGLYQTVDAVSLYIRQWMYLTLSYYDVASESEITLCNKIEKPLVVYRLTENVMTSITTLRT